MQLTGPPSGLRRQPHVALSWRCEKSLPDEVSQLPLAAKTETMKEAVMPYKARPIKDRFFEKLPADLDPEKCREWEGAIRNGYGAIFIRRKPHRVDQAHRLSWEIANNCKIPKGKQVNHTCDNRRCVNPAHLYVGTQLENMKDMEERRGYPRGERHPKASVPDDVVREAVLLHRSSSRRGRAVKAAAFVRSKGYSCSPLTVGRWSNGKLRQSSLNQIQEDRVHPDTPSNTTCEVDQVESLQGKGEQLCLFTT